MKPVNEWTLQECYAYLREMIWLDVNRGNHLEVIDQMESLTRWIPVEERLPDDGETVLCFSEYGAQKCEYIEGVGFVAPSLGCIDGVTHWRRIDRPEAT
jgi:hypothetical protein